MKEFMAIYLGTPEKMGAWNSLDEQTRRERERAGMEAWARWGEQNHAAIISHGAPLGKTKKIDPSGVSDVRNAMAAYTIVRAESHEAAAHLFEGHPHFSIFPGTSVEVMECLPLPKM